MCPNWKQVILTGAIMAIAMVSLTACNTMPEDDVAKVTPTPLATATVGVENTSDASADANATVAPTGDNAPNVTPDAQTTADVTVTGDATAEPSATGSATAKPTATQKPTATVKPSASATKTAAPTKAPTKKPTATPKKTPTATKAPTATKTATPKPTATAQKEVYQTIEFEGKTYKVLMGRNGNPKLIKDYSTLPKILQAYAHPTFDKEAIIRDIYTYAKTQGFTYFGYAQDVMTEELAWECSWYSPSIVSYLGDSAYNDWEPTELDDIIARREGGFSMVDFLAMQNIDTLCLWVRDYGDSSNRKDYWDNGFYNGNVTKEYALYFMYGWPSEVPDYKW